MKKPLNSFQKEIFQRNYKLITMNLSSSFFKKTALNDPTVKIFKRLFDIFSVIVIIGLLSWLTPILAILIKLDSRGSLLVKKGTDSILLNLIVTNIDLWKSMSKRI
jgi:putative colanic acid biosynthesis UDP-glucose lipid carrier transferase